ncbi:FmdE family protein [Rhodanobacter sp. KK11]|uniref:FmdE family protein n=1 Tax=Rhodanobacter sp. KK11 TaxID=3083255 RepID=UPI0029667990|nr:FmdE family protein [Rhodanobacter sp. KK11]MDW2980100.1 FmdE family protein [Rhodanobacter sp. KK11]
MNYPAFYDQAPRIRMRDPLAAFLGAADDGLLEYAYVDAVRLAGHSCPTVAGAWLMARSALQALYPDEPAERGGITVHMPAAESEGVTGVIAQVLTLVTGAAAGNGFHGIGGRFVRQALLSYAAASGAGAVQFRRRDNGATVAVELDLSTVPAAPNLRELMVGALQPGAGAEQRAAFAQAWQGRVQRLLLEHADDPQVLRLTRLN